MRTVQGIHAKLWGRKDAYNLGSPGDGRRGQSELGGELEGEDDDRSDNLQHMSSFKYAMS